MTIQQEQLGELIPELLPLLEKHYEELTLNKEVVKLNPKWDDYKALEAMGRFVVFTARDAGQIVGYNAFFLHTHMHYADLTVAVNDVFYVRDSHRHGSTALRLIRHAETALKGLGAQKIAYHFKAGNQFAAILKALRYDTEEGVAARII